MKQGFIFTKAGAALVVLMLLLGYWSPQELQAQVATFPYSYDFENEGQGATGCNPVHTMVEAGWLNAAGDDMDWTSDASGTSSSSTGPSDDHTPAPGQFYMYLETSCSAVRTANLESPIFDFTSAPAPQISFWYHMYGATIGSLFFEVTTNGGSTWTTLWSRTGAQHTSNTDPWSQATINASAYGGMSNVRFRFRGVSGTSFTGDMAIDDFLVENLLPDNAGITAMVSPVLGNPPGAYNVDVTLTNFGVNSLNNVTIEWEMGGVPQAPVNFTGPAVPAFGNTNVNLAASVPFANGVTNMKFWTSMPNGVADTDNGNDTLNAIFCTGLVGAYSVGTPTSDFPTIQDALNALNGCGMAGAVTMNVQPGLYTTPLVLDATIPGLSAVNTLTWDGGAQAATLQSATGAVVTLDGADYVTIQNFTLNHTGSLTAFGVLLTNQADNNQILNNRITIASTDFNSAIIAASGSTTSPTTSGNNANNTLVEGNVVTGSYRGVCFYGQSGATSFNDGNVVRNNDISLATNYGVYAYYQDGFVLEGNYIHDFPTTFHYGAYCYYTMNSSFVANRIIADDYALYFGRTNSEAVPTQDALIANNMLVSISDRALYAYYSRNTNFYHNSIKSYFAAFVLSNLDNTVEVKNNIMYSETDFAFESFTSSAIEDMDYNAFYTPPTNPNFISYSGTYTDLADWQANGLYAFDQNSLEGLPQFASPDDLHVDGAFLNDRGVNVGVTVDFDGDVRPAAGATSVDIGADEYTPPYNDAGVSNLGSPTLPISGGFSNVEIEVQNYGIDPLSSFVVEWEINGTPQAAVPYTGSTIPVMGSTTMNLANINFPPSTTQLKFWTSMPNGQIDERTSNDTLELMICPGLQGTYTVGHPSADFATLADAMDALMSCGVAGPVEMQLMTGTYNGPFVVNEIPGASATNTITFNGLDPADATFTHDATGANGSATVALDGADYITIKNFTIISTGTSAAFGVLLTNEANYNNIENNIIDVPYSSGISNVAGVLASASYSSSTGSSSEGNNTNYTTIQGNTITGGAACVILEGGAFDDENVGNSVIGNDLSFADDYGIFVDEQDSLTISQNKVYNLQSSFSDAIFCYDIHNFEISGNEVNSSDYGIYVDGGFSFADKARNGVIVNNMVNSVGASAEALYLSDVDMIYVYHNTLVGSPGVYLNNQSNIDLRNNIMATANDYCFETFDPVSMSGMDYNLYYVSGTGNAVYFGSTAYATLNDWQTTGPAGYDANSVTGNPNFVNGLHVSSALPEDAGTAGIAFAVNEDFDGDMRPLGAAPDIGADERIAAANDAMSVGLVSPMGCGDTASMVTVAIANVGSNLLLNVPITVNVTGDAVANYSFTQALLTAGNTFNINVGTLNTAGGGTYNFEIIVAAGTDTNPQNDTFRVTVTIAPDNESALTNIGDTMVCVGEIANLEVASSVGGTIEWYDAASAGNLVKLGATYTTAPITATTSYYVQMQGCDAARKVITVVPDTIGIAVDLGADSTTICAGTAVELTPTVTLSTAAGMTWSNGSMATMLEVTATGAYSIEVMNANGCKASDTVEVFALPMPMISTTPTNPTCGGYNDGVIALNVSGTAGPYNYAWSNGTTGQNAVGLAGGVYVVTITDNSSSLSCSYTEVVTLDEPTSVMANVDAIAAVCSANDGAINITASGGTPGYSYAWSNGATSEDVIGLAAGNYTVTVSDANGCTLTTSANVTANNPIVANVDTVFNEILSIGGSIDITVTGGSGAAFQYAWSNGATTQDVNNLTAGTYSVTIVDPTTGCEVVIGGIVVEYRIPDMVTELEALNNFNLYPNPTSDKVFIRMELKEVTDVQLEITSVTGQVLQSFAPNNAINQNYEVDMSQYPAGMYLARFIVGDQVATAKIIVSRN